MSAEELSNLVYDLFHYIKPRVRGRSLHFIPEEDRIVLIERQELQEQLKLAVWESAEMFAKREGLRLNEATPVELVGAAFVVVRKVLKDPKVLKLMEEIKLTFRG